MFLELKEYLRNIFNYSGRARRREYWIPSLWLASVFLILFGIAYAAFFQCINFATGDFVAKTVPLVIGIVFSILCVILYLVILLAQISASVRRCHDIGYPGYVFLFCILGSFLCGIGGIVWFVFCCLDSKEENKWGPNPKTAEPDKYTSSASIVGSIVTYIVATILYVIIIFVAIMPAVLGSYERESRPMDQYGGDYGYQIESHYDL